MRKKRNPARLLLSALIAVFSFAALTACKSDKIDESTDETTSGRLPALYYNGHVYVSDGYGSYGELDLLPEGFSECGDIASVCENELPDEEFEARGIASGTPVYANADNIYAVYVYSDDGLHRLLIASATSG